MWPLGENARKARDIRLPLPTLHALTLSPDGSLCAGISRYEPGLRIFETATGKTVKEFELSTFHMLQWCPDGKFFLINGPTTVLWETQHWTTIPIPQFKPTILPAGAIRFFPLDATGLCTTVAMVEDYHKIVLLSLVTRTRLATLEVPPHHSIYEIAISADRRWLVAATAQGQLQCWDLLELKSFIEPFQNDGSLETNKFPADEK